MNAIGYKREGLTVSTVGLFLRGLPEISVEVNSAALVEEGEPFLRFVTDYLSQSGLRFEPGETIAYGYWLVKFQEVAKNLLEVWECAPETTHFVRGIAIVLMFSQSCSMGQTPKAKSPARTPLSEEKQSVRKTVQAFLNSWLVSRDLDSAKLWFGAAVFLNEAILQESCAGYIKPELRSSAAARRIGIDKFLRDFLPGKPIARLSQVINQSSAAQMAEQLGANLANDPRADGFVLAKLAREQIPVSAAAFKDYLRSRLPNEFYASFVPIGEGTVYFLWVREGEVWRILHASLVCV